MDLKRHQDAAEFQREVVPFLLEAEAENCLGIGIVDLIVRKPDHYSKWYLWSVRDRGQVVGAAWQTPPWPIGLSAMPDGALELIVDAAASLPEQLTSVVGPKSAADRFAQLWTSRHGKKVKHTVAQRIYQITSVRPPAKVTGRLRAATLADMTFLEEWSYRFVVDCGLGGDRESAKESAILSVNNGARYLWNVDGEPVSMAAVNGWTPSGIRVSWVYTPPEQRGHGYASAVVAAVSQKMLDSGRRFCFLYTDLANPTSNSIYQRVGYVPVCDSSHHNFE